MIQEAQSYSLEENNTAQKRRGRIMMIIGIIITLVILLFPFFSRPDPIPEAEGVAIALGDVPQAGGEQITQNTPPPPPTPTETIEDKVTTVDDEEAPNLNQSEDKPQKPSTPTSSTNNEEAKPQDAYDPTKFLTGGFGDKQGQGTQGNPLGKRHNLESGNGGGDQGDGDGNLGSRKPLRKCEGSYSGSETGLALVYVCITPDGTVKSAEFRTKSQGRLSTVTSEKLKRRAEECAKQYRFEPADYNRLICGTIPINFDIQ